MQAALVARRKEAAHSSRWLACPLPASIAARLRKRYGQSIIIFTHDFVQITQIPNIIPWFIRLFTLNRQVAQKNSPNFQATCPIPHVEMLKPVCSSSLWRACAPGEQIRWVSGGTSSFLGKMRAVLDESQRPCYARYIRRSATGS